MISSGMTILGCMAILITDHTIALDGADLGDTDITAVGMTLGIMAIMDGMIHGFMDGTDRIGDQR